MSRRSGSAAEADNHSDISPSLESTTCERLGTNYRTRRRVLASFRDLVCFQLFETAQDERPQKLWKTSECVATTYGTFVALVRQRGEDARTDAQAALRSFATARTGVIGRSESHRLRELAG
jgi:hypothetical protein